MLYKIVYIMGIILILPIALFVFLAFAGIFQYFINYRIGIYFGLPFYSYQKSHRLTKLVIPSFMIIIKYPPEIAKVFTPFGKGLPGRIDKLVCLLVFGF